MCNEITQKPVILAFIGLAFLGGTAITNFDLVAMAANGNAEAAMKSLVERVARLEERVATLEDPSSLNSLKVVQLNDDASGNSVGWNPDSNAETGDSYFIVDADVKGNSVVTLSVNEPENIRATLEPCGVVIIMADSGFQVACGLTISEGAQLNYVIITPE